MNQQWHTPLTRRSLLASAAAWPIASAPQWRQTPSAVHLEVTPNPVPVDAPFTVRLSGLEPGQVVTVRGELDDGIQPWTAEAVFEADAHGVIDLNTQTPREGTYAVADSMGLVWSALPTAGPNNAQFYGEGAVASPLVITADIGGNEVARVEVERPLLTSAITHIPLREQGLYGEFFVPAAADPVPAVLVLSGSDGGLGPYLEREAALLASHGFAALALAYFRAGPSGLLPSELVNIPLEYFAKAVDWLVQQPDVRGDRLGVMGHSRGGELALLLGATYPAFEAVVSYVGSGLIFPALNGVDPAWTHNGQPLPHIWNPRNWNDATIPVERINGPVILISAEDDRVWQSVILSQVAADRLQRLHHPYPVEHLQYKDAGHILLAPYQPAAQSNVHNGGTAYGNATAMSDSWPRILRMFDERLRRYACAAKPATRLPLAATATPTSSRASRATASSAVSPASTPPPGKTK